MAAHLSKVRKHVKIPIGFFLAFFIAGNTVVAQTLADPTRPPTSLGTSPEPHAATNAAGPELQSVLISPTRRVAIINGQSIKLGEKFGEATLVKIGESEVVLRNGQDVQVLKLFPNVQKSGSSGRMGKSENRQ